MRRAALVGEEADQSIHRRVMCPADQHRGLPLLRHQACLDQPSAMMRQRRGRNAEPVLDAPDRQTLLARAHENAVEREARRVAQRLELGGCLFDIHGTMLRTQAATVNAISMIIEIALMTTVGQGARFGRPVSAGGRTGHAGPSRSPWRPQKPKRAEDPSTALRRRARGKILQDPSRCRTASSQRAAAHR